MHNSDDDDNNASVVESGDCVASKGRWWKCHTFPVPMRTNYILDCFRLLSFTTKYVNKHFESRQMQLKAYCSFYDIPRLF